MLKVFSFIYYPCTRFIWTKSKYKSIQNISALITVYSKLVKLSDGTRSRHLFLESKLYITK